MVTTCAADDSTVAELGRLVERAAGEKSPLEGAVAKFAKWCVLSKCPIKLFPQSVLLADCVWLASSCTSLRIGGSDVEPSVHVLLLLSVVKYLISSNCCSDSLGQDWFLYASVKLANCQ